MKKMISMLMIASMVLVAASCSKSEETTPEVDAYANSGDKYTGDLDVDYWNTNIPPSGMYVDLSDQEDVNYYALLNEEDNTITITLANVSFCPEPYGTYMTSGMPAMDIVLPNIAFESEQDGTTSYYAAECTPTSLAGFEFTTVIEAIKGVAIKFDSDGKLYVEFDCEITVSDMDMEFNVYFVGTK